jgi:membrane fusion protein, multidrug efflux system
VRSGSAFLVVVIALAFAGCSSQKEQQAPAGGMAAMLARMPAVPVSVAVAARETVPLEVHAVGSIEPYTTVQVKAQIAGELLRAHFAEGSQIKRGDLLFEIDPRPYQEALRGAEAAVSRDIAQQRLAEANLGRDKAQMANAEAERRRYDELLKQGIAARQQYDQVKANADAMAESLHADEAAIESAQAALEADRAAVARAKLDLSYTRIDSPVTGRAGTLLIHPGNLIKANDLPLVVINQIEPTFVSFGVPEDSLQAVRKNSAGRKLPVQATLQDQSGRSVNGSLAVIDNAVDPNTGMIRLKALFDNHEHLLWPGQFVDVVLRLETSEATVVPSEAVQAGQQGQFVYVVKGNQTADFRPVAAGTTVNGKTVIEKGVAPGETVVTDGQLRLFPGAKIKSVPASKIDSQKL